MESFEKNGMNSFNNEEINEFTIVHVTRKIQSAVIHRIKKNKKNDIENITFTLRSNVLMSFYLW